MIICLLLLLAILNLALANFDYSNECTLLSHSCAACTSSTSAQCLWAPEARRCVADNGDLPSGLDRETLIPHPADVAISVPGSASSQCFANSCQLCTAAGFAYAPLSGSCIGDGQRDYQNGTAGLDQMAWARHVIWSPDLCADLGDCAACVAGGLEMHFCMPSEGSNMHSICIPVDDSCPAGMESVSNPLECNVPTPLESIDYNEQSCSICGALHASSSNPNVCADDGSGCGFDETQATSCSGSSIPCIFNSSTLSSDTFNNVRFDQYQSCRMCIANGFSWCGTAASLDQAGYCLPVADDAICDAAYLISELNSCGEPQCNLASDCLSCSTIPGCEYCLSSNTCQAAEAACSDPVEGRLVSAGNSSSSVFTAARILVPFDRMACASAAEPVGALSHETCAFFNDDCFSCSAAPACMYCQSTGDCVPYQRRAMNEFHLSSLSLDQCTGGTGPAVQPVDCPVQPQNCSQNACAGGRYPNPWGNCVCTQCPKGTTGLDGLTCEPCEAGTYNSYTGERGTCKDCDMTVPNSPPGARLESDCYKTGTVPQDTWPCPTLSHFYSTAVNNEISRCDSSEGAMRTFMQSCFFNSPFEEPRSLWRHCFPGICLSDDVNNPWSATCGYEIDVNNPLPTLDDDEKPQWIALTGVGGVAYGLLIPLVARHSAPDMVPGAPLAAPVIKWTMFFDTGALVGSFHSCSLQGGTVSCDAAEPALSSESVVTCQENCLPFSGSGPPRPPGMRRKRQLPPVPSDPRAFIVWIPPDPAAAAPPDAVDVFRFEVSISDRIVSSSRYEVRIPVTNVLSSMPAAVTVANTPAPSPNPTAGPLTETEAEGSTTVAQGSTTALISEDQSSAALLNMMGTNGNNGQGMPPIVPLAVGGAGGALCMLFLVVVGLCFISRRRRRRSQANESGTEMKNQEYDDAPDAVVVDDYDDVSLVGKPTRRKGSHAKRRSTEAPDNYDHPPPMPIGGSKKQSSRRSEAEGSSAPPSSSSHKRLSREGSRRRKKSRGSGLVAKTSEASSVVQQRFIINPDDLEKEEQIGEGSYGLVFRGTWRETEVAIKEVKTDDVIVRKQLIAEAASMQNLRAHPNIVQFFGIVEEPLAIVTEICELGSLDDLLYHKEESKRMLFTRQQTRKIVKGIAQGVAHLHAEKIIHRDLAARNVLLGANFTAKVADLGMARESQGDQNQTMTTVGPIRWMAPEQLENQLYSFQSDVFAMAVIFYEIYHRTTPWPKLSNMKVAQTVLNGGNMDLSDAMPVTIQQVCKQCWQFEPAQRPTAKSIVKELKSWPKDDHGQQPQLYASKSDADVGGDAENEDAVTAPYSAASPPSSVAGLSAIDLNMPGAEQLLRDRDLGGKVPSEASLSKVYDEQQSESAYSIAPKVNDGPAYVDVRANNTYDDVPNELNK